MTVREVAVAAAILLQADDIQAALESQDASADDDVNTLVKCVYLAAAELCADGFPLCVTEELTAVNGMIALDRFSRTPSGVREVVLSGTAMPFSVDSRGVKVKGDGKYTVTYSAVPAPKTLDQTAEVGALCDADMLAYFTARNYCLITGRTDEASVWDQRGNAEAEKRRLTRRARLKYRAWA